MTTGGRALLAGRSLDALDLADAESLLTELQRLDAAA